MSDAFSALERVRASAARALGVELHATRVTFDDGEVRVWTAPLDALADIAGGLRHLLAPTERTQLEAMRVHRIAQRFGGSRAALRAVLAAELGVDAASIGLETGPHGKPALVGRHDPGLGFNVAHSAGVVMVATSRHGAVGVDVECRREIGAVERLSRRALTPAERSLFERWLAEGATPLDAFLRAWTVKEARLKALGLPIGAGLSRDHPEASRLSWQAVAVPVAGDYFGAVAFAPART